MALWKDSRNSGWEINKRTIVFQNFTHYLIQPDNVGGEVLLPFQLQSNTVIFALLKEIIVEWRIINYENTVFKKELFCTKINFRKHSKNKELKINNFMLIAILKFQIIHEEM